MKAVEKRGARTKAATLKARRLKARDSARVRGGKSAPPSGPVPIPYPNVVKK
jgi:hypothetical protein